MVGEIPGDGEADRLRQRQAMLFWFSENALRAESLDDALDAAASSLSEVTSDGLVLLLELLPGEEHMRVRAGAGWVPGPMGPDTVPADVGTPHGHALQTSKPVVAFDLASDGQFPVPRHLRDQGIRTLVDVVIKGRDEPWGILEIASREDRPFDADEIAFLRNCADLIAVTIERFADAEDRVPCPYCCEPVRPEAVNWPFPQLGPRETPRFGAHETRRLGPATTLRLQGPSALRDSDPDEADGPHGLPPPFESVPEARISLPAPRRRVGVAVAGFLLAGGIAGVWWASRPTPRAHPNLVVDAPLQQSEGAALASFATLPAKASSPPGAGPNADRAMAPPEAKRGLSATPPVPPWPPPTALDAPGAAASGSPATPGAPVPHAEVRALQSDLAQLGYDVGPIDGLLGPLTRHAVAAWQADHGEAQSGTPTVALRDAVHRQAENAIPPQFR